MYFQNTKQSRSLCVRFRLKHDARWICGETGSLEHLILDCPISAVEINILFSRLQKYIVNFPLNPYYLLPLNTNKLRILNSVACEDMKWLYPLDKSFR